MKKVMTLSLCALVIASAAQAEDTKLEYPPAKPSPIIYKTIQPFSLSQPDYRTEQLDTYWSDPSDGYVGAMNIKKAKEIAITNAKTRVGVIDGGFLENDDVQYANGWNFSWYGNPNGQKNNADYETASAFRTSWCGTGHGQHVASIIGGTPTDPKRPQGIADVEIIAAKNMHCNDGAGYTNDAILWLSGETVPGAPVIEPVDLINMSFASEVACSKNPEMQAAIDVALSKGIILVAAASNESEENALNSPQTCNGVINVTSTDLQGFKSYFSNYGYATDIAAFGDKLSLPSIIDENRNGEADIVSLGGTSFASPMVAGIIALLLNEEPDLTMTEIQTILSRAGQKTTNSALYTAGKYSKDMISCDNGRCGYGIIDAHQAILEMRKIKKEGVALKNPLAGECNIDFYTDALGNSIDVCSMGDFKLGNKLELPENNMIEIYQVPSHSSLNVSTATLLDTTKKSNYLVKQATSDTLAYRICERMDDGTYACSTDELTPLTQNHLDKPIQCIN